jgi:hypothetical protein
MSARVSFDELFAAFEWVSGGKAVAIDCEAYVNKVTGTVHWSGEGVDEELPDDIDDGSIYVAVPHKSEFDLGRSLALRFVEDCLPQSYETVEQYFRRSGAYSRFTSLLERAGQLEAWYSYEQNAVEKALREWSDEQGLTLVGLPDGAGG